jgi:hypothetical protein
LRVNLAILESNLAGLCSNLAGLQANLARLRISLASLRTQSLGLAPGVTSPRGGPARLRVRFARPQRSLADLRDSSGLYVASNSHFVNAPVNPGTASWRSTRYWIARIANSGSSTEIGTANRR